MAKHRREGASGPGGSLAAEAVSEARKAMSDAQKARWAKSKAGEKK